MQLNRSSQIWTGALRLVPLIAATILLFSIITLSLAAAYGKQLANAPLDPYYTTNRKGNPYAYRWSNTYFVFWSGTTPFLTILQSTTDLILYSTIGLNQVYALIVSIIFFCGWTIQVGYWANCDVSGNWYEAGEGSCYQANLKQRNGDPVGLSTALGNAKVAFSILLLVLYVFYMSFAAAAVHKRRTQSNSAHVGMKVLESS